MGAAANDTAADGDKFAFPEPASTGLTAFLIIYNSIYLAIMVYVVAILIIHRHHRFISPRTPILLIPSQLFVFCFSFYNSISIILGKPAFCLGFNIFYAVLPFFSLHFNLSIPILVYHSDLNALKVSRANGNIDSSLWRILKFLTLKAKMTCILVATVAQAGLIFGVMYLANLPGDCARPGILGFSVFVILFMVILGYYLVRLFKVEDPFHMKLEYSLGSVANIAPLFLIATYPFVPAMYPDWFDFRWVYHACAAATLLANGLFPALLTTESFSHYLERRRITRVSGDQAKEMETKGTIYALNQGMDVFQVVLTNPILIEAFTKFTVSQWCVENVLFYQAVARYKAAWDNSAASNERGMLIIREYVVSNAPMEVNLEAWERTKIVKRSREGNLPLELFDKAQKDIYILMERDSFSNWKKTVEFKQALEKVVDTRSSTAGSKGTH